MIVGLHPESGDAHHLGSVIRKIREHKSERPAHHRPRIDQLNDHDLALRARAIRPSADGIALRIVQSRCRRVSAGKGRVALHDDDQGIAIEHPRQIVLADLRLERRLRKTLRLPGHEQTTGLYGGRLQGGLSEQKDGRFQHGDQRRQEGWRDQGEFNGRRAPLRNAEASDSSRPRSTMPFQISQHTIATHSPADLATAHADFPWRRALTIVGSSRGFSLVVSITDSP